MNERIRELAKQSLPEFYLTNCPSALAKFAELLVEEACLVLEAGKPGVNQVPAEVALHMMQKNLKAYFGVE